MSSKLWTQALEEVKRSPYDHEPRNQFIKEARMLLNKIYKSFENYQLKFHKNDRSLKKAIWMLQIDALDTLRDSIELIDQKKHRIVGKMFRDVLEKLDLASLFYEKGESDRTYLEKWYDGEIIEHRKYREHLQSRFGAEASNNQKEFYKELSQWIHPTYYVLGNSYCLGEGEMLGYDSHSELLISPWTISQYMWMLSLLIQVFIDRIENCGLVSTDEINTAWIEATGE